jgi:acyl-coenzyme A thioesterase PaaI-like protein
VIGEEMVFDHETNVCFGCSRRNERGLQLRFTHVAPSTVEGVYVAPDHVCGAPGIVHGGVQAVLLDEAIGFAVHAHHAGSDDPSPIGEILHIVTVDFNLRYRRPVIAGAPLTIRGAVESVVDRDYHSTASIHDSDGALLTSANARWRRLS